MHIANFVCCNQYEHIEKPHIFVILSHTHSRSLSPLLFDIFICIQQAFVRFHSTVIFSQFKQPFQRTLLANEIALCLYNYFMCALIEIHYVSFYINFIFSFIISRLQIQRACHPERGREGDREYSSVVCVWRTLNV